MLQPTVPAWFEIPAHDLDRAVRFYESVLKAKLTVADMGPMRMGVFPHEKAARGAPSCTQPGYEPAVTGTVVYLSLDDIRPALAGFPGAGGEVLLPLTELPEGAGVFAQIRDTEGNRVGLSRGLRALSPAGPIGEHCHMRRADRLFLITMRCAGGGPRRPAAWPRISGWRRARSTAT